LFNKPLDLKTDYTEKTTHTKSVIEPAINSELLTNIKTSVTPDELDFNKVVSMWQGFINIINTEKGFLLGPALENLKPIKLIGNQLNVKFRDDESQKTFGMHEKYIEQKCEDYFGKRLRFKSTSDENISSKSASKKTSKVTKSDQSDPYEQIILNELGGQKIE
jgi:hypothetical protein